MEGNLQAESSRGSGARGLSFQKGILGIEKLTSVIFLGEGGKFIYCKKGSIKYWNEKGVH